ncbi:MarR family winged helix-turn-helix transcriptional regulator [Saccharopolyspora gloriosae]|uniref:MarR family winged helix-turn-helix transcriptional regulator n=1 Tax=Saccharopolyspora gloriosae TaxID=455344 RepID=UPI001FB7E5BD|nr:MarR family winged helix-turn-helix transcriptional regulator [Saccharopolyspora gloriosae]
MADSPSCAVPAGSAPDEIVPPPCPSAVGPVSHAVFRLARLHRMFAGQLLRSCGLHPGQELLLMHLWNTGTQRQTDLIKVLGSDSATMTRTVQRLERAGFVRRIRSDQDKRVVLVEATAAGLALRDRVERMWAELERATTSDLSAEEQTEVLNTLERLERNILGSECAAALDQLN